ncbi:MAG: transketolase [Candidatus Melainabacteria bacterium GWF2_37_15]|nr:MAG: transketolase [Candidatus Melainabacteria bacterium GWF2_37_15]
MSDIKTLSGQEIEELSRVSNKLREQCLTMIHKAQSGHPGGTFSALDLMLVLYKKVLKQSPEWCNCNEWCKRDRFVLSKGHASAALYSVLANCGYFCEDELASFRKLGGRLQGHPGCNCVPGVEIPAGSLGQGLSMANGIAMALRLDNNPSNVFVMLGDGELQEGQVWEAAMSTSHYKLNSITAIVDRNRLQIDGGTESVKGLEPLSAKWQAFGWEVIEIDGHDYQQIYGAYQQAIEKTKPTVIIANTIKGKGVSFMENNAGWHGRATNEEEFMKAVEELRVKC